MVIFSIITKVFESSVGIIDFVSDILIISVLLVNNWICLASFRDWLMERFDFGENFRVEKEICSVGWGSVFEHDKENTDIKIKKTNKIDL